MCLTTVTSKKKENVSGYGWKIFIRLPNGHLIFAHRNGLDGCPKISFNNQIEAIIPASAAFHKGNSYPIGFHLFASRAGTETVVKNMLKEWELTDKIVQKSLHILKTLVQSPDVKQKPPNFVIHQVQYNTVLARGSQWNRKIIVAKYITVLKEEVPVPKKKAKRERPSRTRQTA